MTDWRYLSHGKVKHALERHGAAGDLATAAICGTQPTWFREWHGAGTQDEHEQLEALPKCRRCLKRGAA
jgi:hypothetical protein